MTWCDKQYPKEADEHQKNIDQPYGVEMITMITQWIRPPSVDRSAIWIVFLITCFRRFCAQYR